MAVKQSRARAFLFPSPPEIPPEALVKAKNDDWTLSQERVFMEDLVYKRLTLFLAVAAALVTGAINLRGHLVLSIPLLALGTLLCWVLQQTIHRAQIKLDIILAILFQDLDHPTGYINSVLTDNSRVKWVGYLVPTVICLLLTILTGMEIASYAGLIHIDQAVLNGTG